MGEIVSLHSKTLPSHIPRAKDGLRAVYVRTCHVFTSGSGVVHGWSRSGTGMERYGTGSGTKRPTPAQHCHHAAHLYQNSQFGARIAQQAILRLPAGSSQAHLYNQTPQLCHSLQHFKWCRHKPATGWEGGRVTSNPFLDCQLAATKHIPTITQQSR